MKRIWSFILAAVLLLALAACGGASPESMTDGYDLPAEAPQPAPGYEGDAGGGLNEDWYGYSYGQEEGGWYSDSSGGEEYDDSPEDGFKSVFASPLSTFSSDVDTASYSNMRRFLNDGMRPEGVRIEELVNYFDYGYNRPGPGSAHPFTLAAEVAPCPWNPEHQLAMIGIQGAELAQSDKISSNIVFLLDVSGSMNEPNKLPLLKESFKLLINELDKNDVISIVTYAGSNTVVADSVRGDEHRLLKGLMDDLQAGGGTAGAQGLRTAYQLADENYIEGGNNRIILATDGDFNIGENSDDAMLRLIEEERDRGVYISVLGFGMWNLKDKKMETIADSGNGNYAYIDTLAEAQKVLVDEFESTMFTIAKDLKIQVAFNPAVVGQYRLIGYNNRRLENRDFSDDTKDAGDIGSGHSVTAFYELVPAAQADDAEAEDLVYQTTALTGSNEYMTVKLRYKKPFGSESILAEYPVGQNAYTGEPSENYRFASAVAEFGLVLTNSEYQADSSLERVLRRASTAQGSDKYGLRAEFCKLVDNYREIRY